MREDEWKAVYSFFEDLKDNYDHPVACVIDLMKTIESFDVDQNIWPSTSHSSLGLSYFEEFSDRLNNPMVYIFGNDNGDEFIVSKQKGQGNTVEEITYNVAESASLFKDINSWLSST